MIRIICFTCSGIFYAKRSAERKYCSRKCFVENYLMGENNHKWKGDNAGYDALHDWVKIRMGSAFFCAFDDTHKSNSYQWANISGNYKRDLDDWIPLCASCHVKYDYNEKRHEHLKKIAIGRKEPWNKGKKGIMPDPWNKGKHTGNYGNGYKKGSIPWNKSLI